MSEPDLDKIRFYLFFESLYKRWGLSNSEGTLEREKGLIQNQEESTKKHNTQILTKFWFLIYKILVFFHCKKKGRRWGQKKLVWKKCLSKSLQCFLSKPLEQFLADIPVTLILYLFLHQCRVSCYSSYTCLSGGWPGISHCVKEKLFIFKGVFLYFRMCGREVVGFGLYPPETATVWEYSPQWGSFVSLSGEEVLSHINFYRICSGLLVSAFKWWMTAQR